MRAGVHDLLFDYSRDFPLNPFGGRDVHGLPMGLFQGDHLFAVRAFWHAEILSRTEKTTTPEPGAQQAKGERANGARPVSGSILRIPRPPAFFGRNRQFHSPVNPPLVPMQYLKR
jgi:hypothetical protein